MNERYFATIVSVKPKNKLEKEVISLFSRYEHCIVSVHPEALEAGLQKELEALNRKHTACTSLAMDLHPLYSRAHVIEAKRKASDQYVCRMILTRLKEEGESNEKV